MGRKFIRKSQKSIEELIDDALDREINLFVLRSKDVVEKEGKKYYVVDSIHFLGTYMDYQGDEELIEILYDLKEPILVPLDFNSLSEDDKMFYILFFKDIIPISVLEYLRQKGPRPVIIVVPPHLGEKISQEIELRYEDLGDFIP